MPPPDAIVSAARGWLGTPYHHQGSVRGAGCDCLGLIRGVWRALYGPEPEALPAYTRDWGNATGSETLIAAACRHLMRLDDVTCAAPGDVLVFRMRDRGVAKHAGILVSALPASGLLERDGPSLSYRRTPVSSDERAVAAVLDSGLRRNDDAHGSRPGRHPEVRVARASKDGRASRIESGTGSHHDAGAEPRMIHAQEGLGVVEVPLGRWWRRRAVAAFRFPDITPSC